MTTIHDVARMAQVSTATVSHVINKTRKVNPETIERVESAIHELHYQPNEQARSLKTGQSHLIGVMNFYSVDAYFSEVLSSLEASAFEAGYGVLLRHTADYGEDQGAAIRDWHNKKLDGLIINSPYVTGDFYEQIMQLGCPCVILHIHDPACPCDIIRGNDLEVTEEATRYLIGLGHQRIACIAGCAMEYQTASQRHSGYERALHQAGLPMREDYFRCSEYSIQESYNQARDLLGKSEAPTALLTYSDLLAIGVLRAAADLGLDVPGDVSVIGFDDVELASFSVPRLTTIYQDKQLMGELAVQQVLNRIQDPTLPREEIVLPARLVIRESTGPIKRM